MPIEYEKLFAVVGPSLFLSFIQIRNSDRSVITATKKVKRKRLPTVEHMIPVPKVSEGREGREVFYRYISG